MICVSADAPLHCDAVCGQIIVRADWRLCCSDAGPHCNELLTRSAFISMLSRDGIRSKVIRVCQGAGKDNLSVLFCTVVSELLLDNGRCQYHDSSTLCLIN